MRRVASITGTSGSARDRKSDETGSRSPGARRLFLVFAGLFLFNLLLRVFYFRYRFVNGDETVRALTASRLLEGARLYAEVVTDKPPATTFFYAAVFALFGRSMVAVHVAATLWNFATAVMLYPIAKRLYGKTGGLSTGLPAGLWAALLFIYFSTNYHTQDMMAANTELLMALPYTAAFYFFIRSRDHLSPGPAFLAGLMTGLAALFKQVGLFNLIFFAIYEAFRVYDASRAGGSNQRRIDIHVFTLLGRSLSRLLLAGAGFASVLGGFALWLATSGTLADFWRHAVVLGVSYVGALPGDVWLKFMVSRTFAYVAFNGALWWLAVWAAAHAVKAYLRGRRSREGADDRSRADLCVALWGLVSLGAAFMGGRFFGHYFIQVLPALSLLGARGIELLRDRLGDPQSRKRARVAAAALAVFSIFGLVRFHSRTAVLAYETVTGARTSTSEAWGMTSREREAEAISEILRRELGPGEPLYIWGYGGDVYWRSGLTPASRYLTPYYITGRFSDEAPSVEKPTDSFWSENRARLIEDLERTRPRIILDVYGDFETLPYPEIREFIKRNYRRSEKIGPDPSRPFRVLRRRGEE
ncbi:MAG TPA: glycosyltransferase family 39 protein [Blastocatellia bacterium]|jgi:4-amino-4-deoxy-L-arabinose transferase-like glycosyltransferase|nr:glycosyltransferase family 39 protein [Blastocatellia bacterium]